jgi:hypothetical protein
VHLASRRQRKFARLAQPNLAAYSGINRVNGLHVDFHCGGHCLEKRAVMLAPIREVVLGDYPPCPVAIHRGNLAPVRGRDFHSERDVKSVDGLQGLGLELRAIPDMAPFSVKGGICDGGFLDCKLLSASHFRPPFFGSNA